MPIDPTYGDGVTVGADGYLYVYGHRGVFMTSPTEQHVARVLIGQETGPITGWEFYDGTGWVVGTPTASVPMSFAGPPDFDLAPLAGFTTIPYTTSGGSSVYLASAKYVDVLSDEVSTWVGPNPWGPWTWVGKAAITGGPYNYEEPAGVEHSRFRYGGRVLTLPGGLTIVLWSQNQVPLSDVTENSWLYRVFYKEPLAGSLP